MRQKKKLIELIFNRLSCLHPSKAWWHTESWPKSGKEESKFQNTNSKFTDLPEWISAEFHWNERNNCLDQNSSAIIVKLLKVTIRMSKPSSSSSSRLSPKKKIKSSQRSKVKFPSSEFKLTHYNSTLKYLQLKTHSSKNNANSCSRKASRRLHSK